MSTVIAKWGNSLAVRIPRHLADRTALAEGTPVEISAEDGALVIRPQPIATYQLDDLLSSITPENLHTEVDSGTAVGHECG